jgi:hypothetical protein
LENKENLVIPVIIPLIMEKDGKSEESNEIKILILASQNYKLQKISIKRSI